MKKTILLALFLSSCASNNLEKQTTTEELVEIKAPVQVKTVKRGEVVRLDFSDVEGVTPSRLVCNGDDITFQKTATGYTAYYAETYFSNLKDTQCFVLDKNDFGYLAFNLDVQDTTYPSERLNVDQKRVRLSRANQQRVKTEQKMLNKLYAEATTVAFFDEGFRRPLNSKVTSYYGSQRVFNNDLKTQHLGTDFRAWTGTKIPVANKGKVVFAGDLFYTGYTVIVNHGLGIFTNYGHMSKLLVNAGDIVEKGQVVGLSGNTGRSTAPHLHWGVKVHGNYINGLSLIDQTKVIME